MQAAGRSRRHARWVHDGHAPPRVPALLQHGQVGGGGGRDEVEGHAEGRLAGGEVHVA